MKLRNKKTGEIREDSDLGKMLSRYEMPSFESISELCEEWEDYKPTEPLIKDEKIRKVVRAWAECCCIPLLKHYFSNGFSCFICKDEEDNEYCLDFTFRIDNLAPEHIYTIAELCGEEEE